MKTKNSKTEGRIRHEQKLAEVRAKRLQTPYEPERLEAFLEATRSRISWGTTRQPDELTLELYGLYSGALPQREIVGHKLGDDDLRNLLDRLLKGHPFATASGSLARRSLRELIPMMAKRIPWDDWGDIESWINMNSWVGGVDVKS